MAECDAWTEWYEKHGAALLLLARQWVGAVCEAEDIVQEAFVRFWKTRETVKDAEAYLFRCAKHVAMDVGRARVRRRRYEEAVGRFEGGSECGMFETGLEMGERQRMIEAGLAGLPVEQREVIVMKIWGGLTFEKIGNVLGASMNTAASRYRYGLKALKESLSEELVA